MKLIKSENTSKSNNDKQLQECMGIYGLSGTIDLYYSGIIPDTIKKLVYCKGEKIGKIIVFDDKFFVESYRNLFYPPVNRDKYITEKNDADNNVPKDNEIAELKKKLCYSQKRSKYHQERHDALQTQLLDLEKGLVENKLRSYTLDELKNDVLIKSKKCFEKEDIESLGECILMLRSLYFEAHELHRKLLVRETEKEKPNAIKIKKHADINARNIEVSTINKFSEEVENILKNSSYTSKFV